MSDLWRQIEELAPEKRALLEQLLRAEGIAPGSAGPEEAAPPRTPVEATLERLWSEVLETGPVGVHANFFRLGGDSIHCIQIVARARREGIGITTRQLFDHPTIAGLAAVAEVSPLPGAEMPDRPFSETGLSAEELERLLNESGYANVTIRYADDLPGTAVDIDYDPARRIAAVATTGDEYCWMSTSASAGTSSSTMANATSGRSAGSSMGRAIAAVSSPMPPFKCRDKWYRRTLATTLMSPRRI